MIFSHFFVSLLRFAIGFVMQSHNLITSQSFDSSNATNNSILQYNFDVHSLLQRAVHVHYIMVILAFVNCYCPAICSSKTWQMVQ